VKSYLENIPDTVQMYYGKGMYEEWHGDSKSQSGTKIVFQTKSMLKSAETLYVTIVAQKKQSNAYVTYESSTWPGPKDVHPAKPIIAEMIKAIDAKI